MNHQPVKSSHISSVAYDADTAVLQIKFTGGGMYDYHDVPPEEYARLLTAESVGTYFGRAIRGKYKSSRVN